MDISSMMEKLLRDIYRSLAIPYFLSVRRAMKKGDIDAVREALRIRLPETLPPGCLLSITTNRKPSKLRHEHDLLLAFWKITRTAGWRKAENPWHYILAATYREARRLYVREQEFRSKRDYLPLEEIASSHVIAGSDNPFQNVEYVSMKKAVMPLLVNHLRVEPSRACRFLIEYLLINLSNPNASFSHAAIAHATGFSEGAVRKARRTLDLKVPTIRQLLK